MATKASILSTERQRFMAKRVRSTVTELPSSHVLSLSHPKEAAKAIKAAAQKE